MWLQTEPDNRKSYYQFIDKLTISEKIRKAKKEEGNLLLKPNKGGVDCVMLLYTLFLWWLKPRLWLVDLNYNIEFDWLVELSDNILASGLVENMIF